MTTLYIIGNGFDLWHELPTSYDHFYQFAKDVLEELEPYYEVDAVQGRLWCDFEKSLGFFNWSQFYEFYDHTDVTSEDFRPSEAFGLEDELTEEAEHLVKKIRDCFHAWIDDIDVSSAKRKMRFAPSSRFLTFNYTATLQSVYGVDDDNVFHIHGKSDRLDELIFGHREAMEEEPELDENDDNNRTIFSDAEGAAKYPFYALQKPVDEIIQKNREYFESLHGITDVMVIGHSLNNVDLPYFRELAQNMVGSRWFVYCYKDEEKAGCFQQLLNCDIREENIHMCMYSDIAE